MTKVVPAVDFQSDIETVGQISAVPTILEVVQRTTGMRLAAVARVTEDRWVACSVLDELDFGLRPGSELPIDSTICHQIRQSLQPVVIDHVASDSQWVKHQIPLKYGFQSYISVPIILADGSFFGTLCALDPNPARLKDSGSLGMFRLFAELIATHIDSARKLATAELALSEERRNAELREQFIAVMAHDLRSPLRAVSCFADLLLRTELTQRGGELAHVIRDSAYRMTALVDNLMDLTRSRLGSGIVLHRDADKPLEPLLRSVMLEVKAGRPNLIIDAEIKIDQPLNCDSHRVAQLFSNLLSNAVSYGSAGKPVRVKASTQDGFFELCVANSGEPIPPSALPHLFQPFYRSAISKNREGLGLGLYIAHQIAIAHGGTLQVSSNDEETCFTFRCPCAA